LQECNGRSADVTRSAAGPRRTSASLRPGCLDSRPLDSRPSSSSVGTRSRDIAVESLLDHVHTFVRQINNAAYQRQYRVSRCLSSSRSSSPFSLVRAALRSRRQGSRPYRHRHRHRPQIRPDPFRRSDDDEKIFADVGLWPEQARQSADCARTRSPDQGERRRGFGRKAKSLSALSGVCCVRPTVPTLSRNSRPVRAAAISTRYCPRRRGRRPGGRPRACQRHS